MKFHEKLTKQISDFPEKIRHTIFGDQYYLKLQDFLIQICKSSGYTFLGFEKRQSIGCFWKI